MNEQEEEELRDRAIEFLRAAVAFGQALIWVLEEADEEGE